MELKPVIELGNVVATQGAVRVLEENQVNPVVLITAHACGDWGMLCEEDKKANDVAVLTGDRILSAYRMPDGTKVWVITECDRSVTTLLLPSEY
jgi:hypothetical protein